MLTIGQTGSAHVLRNRLVPASHTTVEVATAVLMMSLRDKVDCMTDTLCMQLIEIEAAI